MRKPNQANQGTSKSIIEVVVNGMTSIEAIKDVKVRLEKIEKSVFNIALLSAYSVGVTIPQYVDNKGVTHGEAKVEKPITRGEMLKEVGRSKQTLSRWLIAMELVIDNKYFNDFAMGKYPFSYDKIITIFRNKEAFEGESLDDLMKKSASTLDAIVDDFNKSKKSKEATTEEVKEATSEATTEATSEEVAKEEKAEEVENIVLEYNGKKYEVGKVAFEKWLSENAKIVE